MQPIQEPSLRQEARSRLIHMLAQRLVRESLADAAQAKAAAQQQGRPA